jgi:hypothetical protein
MMSKQNESKTLFVLKYALLLILFWPTTHFEQILNDSDKDFVGKQNSTELNENYKFNLYSTVVSESKWIFFHYGPF